jgi:hypothetical protein
MDFRKRIKGVITQSLVQAILNDVKYRVMPLGIEEVIRELNTLSVEEYHRMSLPQSLRKLPDFFVTTADQKVGWLLEVKYRKCWDDTVKNDLGLILQEQVKLWSPLYMVLFVGEPARQNDTPASFIGTCKLVIEDGKLGILKKVNGGFSKDKTEFIPWSRVYWSHFNRFQDTFPGVTDSWEQETLIKTVRMMKSLYDL